MDTNQIDTGVHDQALDMDTVMDKNFLKTVDMVMDMDFQKSRGADMDMNFQIKMIKS